MEITKTWAQKLKMAFWSLGGLIWHGVWTGLVVVLIMVTLAWLRN